MSESFEDKEQEEPLLQKPSWEREKCQHQRKMTSLAPSGGWALALIALLVCFSLVIGYFPSSFRIMRSIKALGLSSGEKPASRKRNNSTHFEARASMLNISASNNATWGPSAPNEACFGKDYHRVESYSHCFNDPTHNTCCLLDKWSREANDMLGNPIGQASFEALKSRNDGLTDSEELLTPWCTCFGSQVCSMYSSKAGRDKIINDARNRPEAEGGPVTLPDYGGEDQIKTRVAFIQHPLPHGGKPGSGLCMGTIPQTEILQCEGWAREKWGVHWHTTPGAEGLPLDPSDFKCPPREGQQEVPVGSCFSFSNPANRSGVQFSGGSGGSGGSGALAHKPCSVVLVLITFVLLAVV